MRPREHGLAVRVVLHATGGRRFGLAADAARDEYRSANPAGPRELVRRRPAGKSAAPGSRYSHRLARRRITSDTG